MTEDVFRRKMKRAEQKKEDARQRAELRAIKNEYKKRPTTTKVIVGYLFVLLNVIVVYAMWAMYQLGDLSYLGVLISDIAAQVVVFMIYAAKSYSENREQAKVQLEYDKMGSGSGACNVVPTEEA